MPLSLSRLVLLSAMLAMAGAAWAQGGRGGDVPFELSCRPPLKFAAGACVPQCPGGYEDRGRFCVYRSMSSGGGGGGR